MAMTQAERTRYVNLINAYFPDELSTVVSNSISGLGATGPDVSAQQAAATPSTWDSIVTGFQQIVPTYLSYRQQQQIAKIQRQRMEQGLPPLTAEQMAPTAKLEHGITPETADAMKKMLPFIISGGIALVMILLKRRI